MRQIIIIGAEAGGAIVANMCRGYESNFIGK
jgi:hypothetical protein